MKKSGFKETQIVAMLQQYDSAMKVTDICRDKGITTATFYSWKRKTVVWTSSKKSSEVL